MVSHTWNNSNISLQSHIYKETLFHLTRSYPKTIRYIGVPPQNCNGIFFTKQYFHSTNHWQKTTPKRRATPDESYTPSRSRIAQVPYYNRGQPRAKVRLVPLVGPCTTTKTPRLTTINHHRPTNNNHIHHQNHPIY